MKWVVFFLSRFGPRRGTRCSAHDVVAATASTRDRDAVLRITRESTPRAGPCISRKTKEITSPPACGPGQEAVSRLQRFGRMCISKQQRIAKFWNHLSGTAAGVREVLADAAERRIRDRVDRTLGAARNKRTEGRLRLAARYTQRSILVQVLQAEVDIEDARILKGRSEGVLPVGVSAELKKLVIATLHERKLLHSVADVMAACRENAGTGLSDQAAAVINGNDKGLLLLSMYRRTRQEFQHHFRNCLATQFHLDLAAHAAREVKSAAAVGNTAALRVSADVLAVLGVHRFGAASPAAANRGLALRPLASERPRRVERGSFAHYTADCSVFEVFPT